MTTEPVMEHATIEPLHSIKFRKTRKHSYRDHWDIIALLIVGVLGAATALLGAPIAVRTAFGLPLIIFIPGYALVSALFPTNEGLDGLERIALGFGLSLAQIPLIALGIEFSPWRLSLAPIVASLVTSAIIFSAIARFRRNRAPAAERFIAEIPQLRVPPVSTWSRTTKFALGIMLVALLLFGGSSAILVAERLRAEPTTEFAIYNAAGQTEFYPRDFASGQSQSVQLEIDNHEGTTVDYRLEVVAGTTNVGSVDSISVESGKTWRQPISLVIPPSVTTAKIGASVPLVFNLYRADVPAGATPYRSLRLYINLGTPTSTP